MKGQVIMVTLLVFLCGTLLMAEGTEKESLPVLKKGDVKHFIKTFPALKKDMEKFGARTDAKEGSVTVPEAMKASSEFMAILKKHGWDEHFFAKITTIHMGYASIVYKGAMKTAGKEMEKSIAEIKNNTTLSDAMKKQLIESMKTAKGMMKGQTTAFSKRIHKADMMLIRPLVKELKAVIEEKK